MHQRFLDEAERHASKASVAVANGKKIAVRLETIKVMLEDPNIDPLKEDQLLNEFTWRLHTLKKISAQATHHYDEAQNAHNVGLKLLALSN